jgi:hypothetical protein
MINRERTCGLQMTLANGRGRRGWRDGSLAVRLEVNVRLPTDMPKLEYYLGAFRVYCVYISASPPPVHRSSVCSEGFRLPTVTSETRSRTAMSASCDRFVCMSA